MNTTVIKSRVARTSSHSLHTVTRRKYDILQPPPPPSAIHYQMSKLQALNSSRVGVFSKLRARFNASAAKHPLILGTSLATLKAIGCDSAVQYGVEQRTDAASFNWSRSLLFASFGLLYCGFVQYGIYNKLYPKLFQSIKSGVLRNSVYTMADMAIHSPLLYFPMFYVFKGCVYEQSVSIDVARQQLYQYFGVNFKEDMIALYKLWLPALLAMFAVVPLYYRPAFLFTLGAVWNMSLSMKRGEKDANIVQWNESDGNHVADISNAVQSQQLQC